MTQNEEEKELQAIYRYACELQNKIYGSYIYVTYELHVVLANTVKFVN